MDNWLDIRDSSDFNEALMRSGHRWQWFGLQLRSGRARWSQRVCCVPRSACMWAFSCCDFLDRIAVSNLKQPVCDSKFKISWKGPWLQTHQEPTTTAATTTTKLRGVALELGLGSQTTNNQPPPPPQHGRSAAGRIPWPPAKEYVNNHDHQSCAKLHGSTPGWWASADDGTWSPIRSRNPDAFFGASKDCSFQPFLSWGKDPTWRAYFFKRVGSTTN